MPRVAHDTNNDRLGTVRRTLHKQHHATYDVRCTNNTMQRTTYVAQTSTMQRTSYVAQTSTMQRTSCVHLTHLSQVTYTPIVGLFLNWPPDLRSLLASIWMFGIMPPKVKDYQQMLLPIVEQLAKYAPGPTGEDLDVYDADTAADRALRLLLVSIMNDIRAVPCGTCGKHPPCYVGTCNFCKQCGRRVHGRTVLGGAVRGVGAGTSYVSCASYVL
jgi:hypothetical protein